MCFNMMKSIIARGTSRRTINLFLDELHTSRRTINLFLSESRALCDNKFDNQAFALHQILISHKL